MSKRYEPPSEFLKALIEDDASLVVGEHAAANLDRLIKMTRDKHAANRDWATFLLAHLDIDTPQMRDALLTAAADEEDCVRAEAILGLAQRDKSLAVRFLQQELSRGAVPLPVFEAATIVAHPSLAADLRAFAEPSGNDYVDGLAVQALQACEASA